MVHVARLGHADDRVDQQPAADLLRGPLGQLLVGPVQRVAGLECDDLAPSERLEVLAQLGRSAAEVDEIVVRRYADDLETTGGVVARLPVEVGDRGMLGVSEPYALRRLVLLVVSVDLLDVEEREQVAVDVAQGQRLPFGDAVAGLDRKGHGQGPERPVGKAHLADDFFVVGLAQEALQRREPADGQQLQVAEPALVERQAGEVLGGRLHLGRSRIRDDQVDERPAVGRIQCAGLGRSVGIRGRGRNDSAPFKNQKWQTD